jgi:hypothetical protein
MYAIPQYQIKSIQACINYLSVECKYFYGQKSQKYIDLFLQVAMKILEKIAACDAPYHNLEHTLQVVLVGQEILHGKILCGEQISPQEWFDFMVSLLCHDIGYLKGICNNDNVSDRIFATGIEDKTIVISPNSTGASLAPYHVDRGKLFVKENLNKYDLVDVNNVQLNIEFTRFPVPTGDLYNDTVNYPGLARSADLIGQLSDPSYLLKLPALFSEFEEIGSNQALGYSSSKDLRYGYPRFYWHCVSIYLRQSIRYLEVSQAGQAILANLYNNRDTVEKELDRLYNSEKSIFRRFLRLFL